MTDATAPGATPQDWSNLVNAGVMEDLLPVAMDPNTPVLETSALAQHKLRGKVPSRYTVAGRIVGIPGWTQMHATQADIDTWAADPTLGICLQTRNVRALDIDIDDRDAAQAVVDFVRLVYPDMPARGRDNSGKVLLAFSCPSSEPLPYRNIPTPTGVIELLSDGKQFVAVGTHPSGSRYEWEGGTPDSFPELTRAQLDGLWSTLAQAFGDPNKRPNVARGTLAPPLPRSGADAVSDDMVDFLQLNGWVRKHRNDGCVDITCPFENEHTTENTIGSTTYFPAGVGGFDDGHFRCLHAHCADRTDDDFAIAVGYVADQFSAIPDTSTGGDPAVARPRPKIGWQRNKDGTIKHTVNNLSMAMQSPEVCGAVLSFDAFRHTEMVQFEGEGQRELRDNDYVTIWRTLERRGFESVRMSRMVKETLRATFQENTYDSAITWASSLVWDGVPRVDTAMERYFGVSMRAAVEQGITITHDELRDYSRAVGRYLFTALAGRCLDPGCQADMVPILVGKQGTGKTTSARTLAAMPDSFGETDLMHLNPDTYRKNVGKLVVELAELRGLVSRDAETIKAWISDTADSWVPKWCEKAIRFPRRFVLIGTTNDVDILYDPTGARRFLPLPVSPADTQALKRDVEQLWAEGIELWSNNGVLALDAERLARSITPQYTPDDTHEDAWVPVAREFAKAQIEEGTVGNEFHVKDFLAAALNIAPKDQSVAHQRRAGRALRQAGFVKVRKLNAKGNRLERLWSLFDFEQYLV